MNKLLAGLVIGVLIAGVGVWAFRSVPADASAPSGAAATVRTSNTIVVGPDGATENGLTRLFTSNDTCSARVISTSGSALFMSLGSTTLAGEFGTTSPSAGLGHFQATSTNVEYDSGLYGCGEWTVYANSSSTITVTELR